MNRLCELALKYGTDKTPYWNNCTGHCYTPFYEDLLRGREIKNILEIGICTGASLRMWEEYFPEAKIWGIDIDPNVLFDTDRIKTFQCDAGDEDDLMKFEESVGLDWADFDLDLIIDDGSHLVKDQIIAARWMIPTLSEKGLYVIEDVQQGTEEEIASKIGCQHHIVYPTSNVAPHRSDDCLIVAWRTE